MTIEKHISMTFEVANHFESPSKLASWQPQSWVQPDVQAFVTSLKADPRFAYMHTIGMSDGDAYGPNLNGDIFTIEELLGMQTMTEAMRNTGKLKGTPISRLKTFESAKFFRHHDNKPTSPFFGDIPFVAWNQPMARAEHIVRIARMAIPELGMRSGADIVDRLEKRGRICVSMGTKIAYEQCTYCGSKNQEMKDRCAHLATMMGRIMPNGVKVAARNFGMRFFDLSDVGDNPADPIAESLAKVAANGQPYTINHAMDVADDPVAIPGGWIQKRSEMTKIIPPEPTLEDNTPRRAGEAACSGEALTSDELATLAKTASTLKQALSTLTLSGVVLSPLELAELTCAYEPSAKIAAKAEDIQGFDSIPLDNFSSAVYSALCTKIAARSGFGSGTVPGLEWEPEKIAFGPLAEYYAFYRNSIGQLPKASFLKAACAVPALRDLHQCDPTKLNSGLHSLIHSGRNSVSP